MAHTKLDAMVTDLNRLCDEMPFHTGWFLNVPSTGFVAYRLCRICWQAVKTLL